MVGELTRAGKRMEKIKRKVRKMKKGKVEEVVREVGESIGYMVFPEWSRTKGKVKY